MIGLTSFLATPYGGISGAALRDIKRFNVKGIESSRNLSVNA